MGHINHQKHISENQKAKKHERIRKFFESKKIKLLITNNSIDIVAQGNVPLCSEKLTEHYLI